MNVHIETSDYDDDGGYFIELVTRDASGRRSLGAGASSWSQEKALTGATASATVGIVRRMKAREITPAEAVAQAQAVALAAQGEYARQAERRAQYDEAQVRG